MGQRCNQALATTLTDAVFILIPVFVNIAAKKMLEKSEHRLHCLIRSQKQEIVNEKVLRCEIEFARDGLPASSSNMTWCSGARARHAGTTGRA